MVSIVSANLNDDLVSYYKMDDDLATTNIIDSLGLNNGTLDGGDNTDDLSTNGIINLSLNFNGIDDYVDTGFAPSYSNNTWTLWYNGTTSATRLMSSLSTDPRQSSQLDISVNAEGFLQISVFDDVSSKFLAATTGTINDNTWHFIALTIESDVYARGYVDGVEIVNFSIDTITPANTQDLWLMRYPRFDTTYANGTLDEVGVWNRTLSQSEITELWNGGNGLTYPFTTVGVTVALITPINNSLISTTDINFTANISSGGLNLTNATYFVWYDNGTLFNQTTVTLPNTNETSYTLEIFDFDFDNYKWNLYGCSSDNTCSFSNNNNTFTVSPFSVDVVTYNTSVYETSSQTFSINISANPTVNSVSGLFWYNDSSYTALITSPSNGKYIATSIIDIPLQNSVGNKSFKWQFDFELTDLSEQQQNTTDYSNEVNRTYIFLCNVTYTSEIINFTTRNAENPFPKVNGIYKSAWQWFLGTGGVFRNMSYEDMTETKSDFDFCGLNDNIDYIFTIDVEADATDFSKNFYYFTEATKTSGNATETDLYLLNDTLSTPTTLLVRDRYQRVISDVLIFVQFYDVGTDTFYTVTMGKTNQNGEDIVYLNWFDSLYKFILVQNGTTILTTNPYKIGDTPQIFQIEDDIVYDFDKFRDFQYSLIFNNATNNFVLTYIKPSGLVESACLRVINRDATGDTEICETCSTSASATLYCNIALAGNGTFIATFYATGSLAVIDWIIQEVGIGMSETIFNLLDKNDAAFYTILMSSIVLLIFLISPVFGILGILAGLLLSSALGFSLISYASFLFISCVGGTIIWLLRR